MPGSFDFHRAAWVFLFFSSAGLSTAWAAPEPSRLQVEQTQSESSSIRLSGREQATQWGLTEEEWTRYETLMQGQRGILSPGLDPLTALGVEARTDAERRRYAELQARFEFERVERELAYQRAYDEATARLAGGKLRVTPFSLKPSGEGASGSAGLSALSAASAPVRYDVVVSIDNCARCEQTVKDMLAKGLAMNLWVTDSGQDDRRIRAWASRLSIPPAKVRSGHITLNHGGKLSVKADALPLVQRRQ
ncbi:TIGR03759 family integrating conjugative element protein [Azotobacter vinelandii]|uniref:TIGR03759 family integrating conjugative element protein n=1 Tax=Azotobacter vinelandii TaxID=354 RepID=UPI000773CE89|nr:TIGR03759 family integrating conjugative element protein [Azotobacter vinelandii]